MQDASSSNPAGLTSSTAAPATTGGRTRLFIVILHYLPLLHAGLALVPLLLAVAGVLGWTGAAALSLVALYLLPAAAVRAATLLLPSAVGEHDAGSPAFLGWWFCAQWQVLFGRFPLLEELLRCVPLLYSAWLRAWGARVGRLVYWSPGVLVFDRQLLEVGDRVIIGAGARLVPHYLKWGAAGGYRLVAAPVRIGNDAIVGGWSLLAPGARVEPGAVTSPGRPVGPARRRRQGDGAVE